jgi:hypothetical protein
MRNVGMLKIFDVSIRRLSASVRCLQNEGHVYLTDGNQLVGKGFQGK